MRLKLLIFLWCCCPIGWATTSDLLIKNAIVVDGTGQPGYPADVAIHQGKIAAILTEKHQQTANRIIDAKGKILSPGFIDLHAHGNPLKQQQFKSFLAMGVTTVVLGQDGSSPTKMNIAKWQQLLNEKGSAVNVASMVGHGSLRQQSGINSFKKATPEQLKKINELLKQQLPFTFGMTTGLEYVPGLSADKTELITLAKTLGNSNKLIMSHMRNEDDDKLFNSIDELIAQGKHTRVHVSHLKSVYGKGSERAQSILNKLEQSQAAGVNITADIYPYNASYTGISLLFPKWAKTPGQLKLAKANRRAELYEYLNKRVMSRNGPAATLFGSGPYKGKTLEQLATDKDKHFADVLIDDIGNRGSSAAYFIMDEALQSELITSSLTAISSDGSPTMYHPRGYGSFAKIIQDYANTEHITLPLAIHKMTGKSAAIMGFKKRGLIKPGYAADLLLFSPDSVKAKATYQQPHQLAEGFATVILNGQLVRFENQFVSLNAGKVLIQD